MTWFRNCSLTVVNDIFNTSLVLFHAVYIPLVYCLIFQPSASSVFGHLFCFPPLARRDTKSVHHPNSS